MRDACREGCLGVIKELIASDSKLINSYAPSSQRSFMWNDASSPLYDTCAYGHWRCSQLLLDAKANPNGRDPDRRGDRYSPICIAAARSDDFIIEKLLSAGASVDVHNEHNESPLHLAVQTKEYVSDHPCAHGDDVRSAHLLIKAGADINRISGRGVTPLGAAVINLAIGCVETLLRAGADPNAGYSPIISRAMAYVERGPDKWDAALMRQYQAISTECGILLLRWGAEPNRVDSYGNAALHIAVRNNNSNGAWVLLQAGADADMVNEDGLSARMLAQGRSGFPASMFPPRATGP